LLGVRAVIAESFERIHRSNLVGMGVLPLEFTNGETRHSLGLTGFETFDITGPGRFARPRATLTVSARACGRRDEDLQGADAHRSRRRAELLQARGILPYVLRQLVGGRA
jgi:aconitate hydratase